MKRYKSQQSGFSIVEVLISLFVVSIGLVTVLSLAIQNIQAEGVGKNTLIASQLAQEGLEIVRNIRDENWLNPSEYAWNQDIKGAPTDTTYAVDYRGRSSLNLAPNSLDDDETILRIYQFDQLSFYEHDNGTPSIFRRLITVVNNVVDSKEISLTVTCNVQWKEKGVDHNYVAETVLYDWK